MKGKMHYPCLTASLYAALTYKPYQAPFCNWQYGFLHGKL